MNFRTKLSMGRLLVWVALAICISVSWHFVLEKAAHDWERALIILGFLIVTLFAAHFVHALTETVIFRIAERPSVFEEMIDDFLQMGRERSDASEIDCFVRKWLLRLDRFTTQDTYQFRMWAEGLKRNKDTASVRVSHPEVSEHKVCLIEFKHGKANTLSVRLLADLTNAVSQAPKDVIFLFGRGTAFSGGLDLRELYDLQSAQWQLRLLIRLYKTLRQHQPATASLVGGKAAAGGVGLAFCANAVVASSTATFWIPGQRGYYPLARILIPIIVERRNIDPNTFKKGRLFGREFSADEAKHYGLVDVVLDEAEPSAELLGEAALSVLRDDKQLLSEDALELRYDRQTDQRVDRLTSRALREPQQEALLAKVANDYPAFDR